MRDLKAFWDSFQAGVEVAVAGSLADELLGIRDGFARYFEGAMHHSAVAVAVVPHGVEQRNTGLYLSDDETIAQAERRVEDLAEQLDDSYHFHVAIEGGLHSLEVAGESLYFIRSWAVVESVYGRALGSSGSVQLPPKLVNGLEHQEIAGAVPGTRRRGGLISSLTGGLETRRTVVRLAICNALSTLFYGVLDPPRGAP